MLKGKGLYIILGLAALAAFYFLYWRPRHGFGRQMRRMVPGPAQKKRGWRSKLGGFAKSLAAPVVSGAMMSIPGGSAIMGAAAESGLL